MANRNHISITVATIILAGLIVKLWLPNNGIVGEYYVGDSSEAKLLHTQTDPSISFKTDILMRSVYTLNWDLDRFPFPEEFPHYSVIWNGYIKIPFVDSKRTTIRGLRAKYHVGKSFEGQPFLTDSGASYSFAWTNHKSREFASPFSIKWNGYISIPFAGKYEFATESDDGSWIYVDGQLIVNNCGSHAARYRSGSIHLSKGEHKIEIRYFDEGGGAILRVLWTPPQDTEQPIPEEQLHHYSPEHEKYALGIVSDGESWISMDNELLINYKGKSLEFSRSLDEGIYPITVGFSSRGGQGGVSLYWRNGHGKNSVVPTSALYPTVLEYVNSSRNRFFSTALLLGIGIFLWLSCRPNGFLQAHFQAYVTWLAIHKGNFALSGIVLLAAFLRFHQYDVVPVHNETADEFLNGWIGLSLLRDGIPYGWLMHGFTGPYEHLQTRSWFGAWYTLGQPVFHPPPLYPVIVGAFASLGGAREIFEVSLSYLRLPSIFLTIFTTFLVFVLCRKLYNEKSAYLASLLYATIPIIVVSGRLAKEENLLAPLFLLAIFYTLKFLDTDKPYHLYVSAALAGLASFTKPPGLCIVGVIAIILASRGKWREVLMVLPICFGFFSGYLVYGWWYDWEMFTEILGVYSTVTTRLDAGIRFIQESKIAHKLIGGGWMVWLWFAAFYVSRKKNKIILIAIIAYLLTLSIMVNSEFVHGWYRIPLYPLLCIAAGVFTYDLCRNPELFKSIIFILTCLIVSTQYYFSADLTSSSWFSRLFVFVTILPFFLHYVFRSSSFLKFSRITLFVLFCSFTVLNVLIVMDFVNIYPKL